MGQRVCDVWRDVETIRCPVSFCSGVTKDVVFIANKMKLFISVVLLKHQKFLLKLLCFLSLTRAFCTGIKCFQNCCFYVCFSTTHFNFKSKASCNSSACKSSCEEKSRIDPFNKAQNSHWHMYLVTALRPRVLVIFNISARKNTSFPFRGTRCLLAIVRTPNCN